MKVQVYRNLNKDCWSVRYQGKVIGHYETLALYDCTFHVQEAGRKRVLKEKQKNVHAYIKGEIVQITKGKATARRISYNPYKHGFFYYGKSYKEIVYCELMYFSEDGYVYELV
jgi:hypothetical protein